MSVVAAAIVGSAVVGVYAAGEAADSASQATAAGADSAAQVTLESTKLQLAEMARQFDYQMEILQPQIEQQFKAQTAYSNLLGLDSQATSQQDQINQEIAGYQQEMNAPGTSETVRQQYQARIDQLQSSPGFVDPNLDPTRLADTSTYSDVVQGNLQAGTAPGADPYRNYVQDSSLVGPGGLADDTVRQDIGSRNLSEGAAGTGVYGDVFKESPGYAFQVEEMNRATDRIGSAGGPNIGGRAIMEAQRRAQGLASGEYYNWASGRERDLGRKGDAERTDIGRMDSTAYNYQNLQQSEQSRGDQAYQNYLQRSQGDATRLDAAALNTDRLQATDMQRQDQSYYNYLQSISKQAGFGGGPAATAVGTSGAYGSNVANVYGNQGATLSNIYQNQGNTQAQIGANKYAGYNNVIQSGLQNYMTAEYAGL